MENATVSLTMSGAKIASLLASSPLMIVVYIAVIAPLVAGIFYYRKKPGERAKLIVLAVVLVGVVGLIFALNYVTVNRSLNYGAWVNGSKIYVRYYDNDIFVVNVCQANISLLTKEQAKSLLSIRTNGISDPTVDVNMGHFRLKNGLKGDVLIIGKSTKYVVAIRAKNEEALVGLPGVKNFYAKLMTLKNMLCNIKEGG